MNDTDPPIEESDKQPLIEGGKGIVKNSSFEVNRTVTDQSDQESVVQSTKE